MKTILSTFLLVFLATLVYSQTATVSGNVSDGENPLPFATVALYNAADSTMAKAGYTEVDGKFLLTNLAAGNYFIQTSAVGFKKAEKLLSLTEGEQKVLGTLTVTTLSAELQEAVIEAERPMVEVKPGKIQFNVEGTTNSIGTNALDLLRKAPGVLVDNNDQVIVQGKTGVLVMINDKPTPMSGDDLVAYLKTLQSSEIDNIEIINNPGVKYDAEGNAGIVNIKLRKKQGLGTNGSLTAGYSIGWLPQSNFGLSLNHRKEKYNVYGSYNLYAGRSKNFQNFYREQFNNAFDQESVQQNENLNNGLRVGLDFTPNKKHSFGVLLNGNLSDGGMRGSSVSSILLQNESAPSTQLVAGTEIDENSTNLSANLNYKFVASENLNMTMDLDYGRFEKFSDSDQPNRYESLINPGEVDIVNNAQTTENLVQILSAKTDFEAKMGKGQLAFGAKVSQIDTDNNFDFFRVIDETPQIDTARTNQFLYSERVTAGYVNYKQPLNEKWSMSAGLRAEHTLAQGDLNSLTTQVSDTVDRNYTSLFPSLGFSYARNQMNSFSMNYGRRIDRPNYQELNPFEYQLDELTFQRGNPFLNPQFTHNVSFSHTYAYRFTTSLTVSRTTDSFGRLSTAVQPEDGNPNASFIMTRNVAQADNINLGFSAPFTIKKIWSVFANIGVNHSRNKATFTEADGFASESDFSLNVTSANVYMQHTVKLKKGWRAEVSGFYASPGIWQGGFKTRRFWFVDAGVQKEIWQGRGNLKVAMGDVFGSQQWFGESELGDLFLTANGGWDSQRLKINFTYFFGDKAVKAQQKRKTGMEEEQRRLQGGGGVGQ